MPHVDEGRLTAFLDGAFAPGDADRMEIEAHLAGCRDCRNRLDEERQWKERAGEILGQIEAPAAVVPPWEELVARGGDVAGRRAGRRPRRFVPLAWAASLVMAIGAGWMAHEMIGSSPSARRPAAVQSAAAPAVAPEEGTAGAVADMAAAARQGGVAGEPSTPAATRQSGASAPLATGQAASPKVAAAKPAPQQAAKQPEKAAPPRHDQLVAGRLEETRDSLAAHLQAAMDTRRANRQSAAGIVDSSVIRSTDALKTAPAGSVRVPAAEISRARVQAAVAPPPTLAYRDLAGEPGRPITTAEARTRLGGVLYQVDGARVLRLEGVGENGEVRVVQQLDDGTVIRLVESRAPEAPGFAQLPPAAQPPQAMVFRGMRILERDTSRDGTPYLRLHATDPPLTLLLMGERPLSFLEGLLPRLAPVR